MASSEQGAREKGDGAKGCQVGSVLPLAGREEDEGEAGGSGGQDGRRMVDWESDKVDHGDRTANCRKNQVVGPEGGRADGRKEEPLSVEGLKAGGGVHNAEDLRDRRRCEGTVQQRGAKDESRTNDQNGGDNEAMATDPQGERLSEASSLLKAAGKAVGVLNAQREKDSIEASSLLDAESKADSTGDSSSSEARAKAGDEFGMTAGQLRVMRPEEVRADRAPKSPLSADVDDDEALVWPGGDPGHYSDLGHDLGKGDLEAGERRRGGEAEEEEGEVGGRRLVGTEEATDPQEGGRRGSGSAERREGGRKQDRAPSRDRDGHRDRDRSRDRGRQHGRRSSEERRKLSERGRSRSRRRDFVRKYVAERRQDQNLDRDPDQYQSYASPKEGGRSRTGRENRDRDWNCDYNQDRCYMSVTKEDGRLRRRSPKEGRQRYMEGTRSPRVKRDMGERFGERRYVRESEHGPSLDRDRDHARSCTSQEREEGRRTRCIPEKARYWSGESAGSAEMRRRVEGKLGERGHIRENEGPSLGPDHDRDRRRDLDRYEDGRRRFEISPGEGSLSAETRRGEGERLGPRENARKKGGPPSQDQDRARGRDRDLARRQEGGHRRLDKGRSRERLGMRDLHQLKDRHESPRTVRGDGRGRSRSRARSRAREDVRSGVAEGKGRDERVDGMGEMGLGRQDGRGRVVGPSKSHESTLEQKEREKGRRGGAGEDKGLGTVYVSGHSGCWVRGENGRWQVAGDGEGGIDRSAWAWDRRICPTTEGRWLEVEGEWTWVEDGKDVGKGEREVKEARNGRWFRADDGRFRRVQEGGLGGGMGSGDDDEMEGRGGREAKAASEEEGGDEVETEKRVGGGKERKRKKGTEKRRKMMKKEKKRKRKAEREERKMEKRLRRERKKRGKREKGKKAGREGS